MKNNPRADKYTTVDNHEASIALTKPNDQAKNDSQPVEIGGRKEGLEPTRYGDWEYKGRCIDF